MYFLLLTKKIWIVLYFFLICTFFIKLFDFYIIYKSVDNWNCCLINNVSVISSFFFLIKENVLSKMYFSLHINHHHFISTLIYFLFCSLEVNKLKKYIFFFLNNCNLYLTCKINYIFNTFMLLSLSWFFFLRFKNIFVSAYSQSWIDDICECSVC